MWFFSKEDDFVNLIIMRRNIKNLLTFKVTAEAQLISFLMDNTMLTVEVLLDISRVQMLLLVPLIQNSL